MEKCYWDLSAGKCKEVPAGGMTVPAGYPVPKTTKKIMPTTTRAPAIPIPNHPAKPATPTPGPMYPTYPKYPNNPTPGPIMYAPTPGPMYPYTYPNVAALPAYPAAYPGQPGQMPLYPGYPNQVPGQIPGQFPGYPPQTPYHAPQTPSPIQTSPLPIGIQGQDCKTLKKEMCFGPAALQDQVCYWDSEDAVCYAGLKGDVEALCDQFSNSREDCDAQLECFFDAQESECSEVEIMNPEQPFPTYNSACENYRTVDKCASEPDCFFEDGVCVNLIQARNICGVLFTPQLCSTNSGCVWQSNMCQISAPRLRQPARQMDQSSDFLSKGVEGLIYLLAGIMVGILLTYIWSWICTKRAQGSSQEIALDLDYYSRHNEVVV